MGITRVRPCTVVLDNASAHVARVFKRRREELAAIGVELFHLPPRSSEPNNIERVGRSAKYEDCPAYVHTTAEAVGTAVDRALNRHAHVSKDQQPTSPRPLRLPGGSSRVVSFGRPEPVDGAP
ncbi:transposase [Streptomyces sp. NBC_00365]|uniref:transposase n=1 Tax=Streptomyces sp. NBC_00365 TaxID=2975726 RepID=UPI00338FBD02